MFDLYVSKLNPKCPWLFQRPKKSIKGKENEEWYDNVPVGPHPLENCMRKLSENAGLSMMYTNHCIRATVITNLDRAGFEARHIKAVSGHKSDETIKNYAVKCPNIKKREMSDVLSAKLDIKRPKPKASSTVTTESTTRNTDQQAEFPTLNVNDIVDFVPIPNNVDDFDINQILKVVEEAEKSTEKIPEANKVPQEDTEVRAKTPVTTPSETATVPNPVNITVPPAPLVGYSPPNLNSVQVNQGNNYPLVPQMYFPGSNVTINYHINHQK